MFRIIFIISTLLKIWRVVDAHSLFLQVLFLKPGLEVISTATMNIRHLYVQQVLCLVYYRAHQVYINSVLLNSLTTRLI